MGLRMRSVLGVMGATVILAALAGCGASTGASSASAAAARAPTGSEHAADPQARSQAGRNTMIPVQVVVAQNGSLAAAHEASGTVVPVSQSQVSAQVSGVVTRVLHLSGDWVGAGEAVVQLDDSQLKLSVASAQAALDSAQINVGTTKAQLDLAELTLQRDQALVKQALIAQNQLDVDRTTAQVATQAHLAAQAAVAQATAQLEVAKLNLQYAAIRAPYAGQVAAVNVQPGDFVGQSAAAFVIDSNDRQIDFSVSPADGAFLQTGTQLTFTYNGRGYPARVSQAPAGPVSGVIPMVAHLTDASILPFGAVGNVSYSFVIAQGVLVPIGTFQTNESYNYVFSVVNGKTVVDRITILGETATTAAVSGVSPGAQVILYPPPGLLEGATVQAIPPQQIQVGVQGRLASGSGGTP